MKRRGRSELIDNANLFIFESTKHKRSMTAGPSTIFGTRKITVRCTQFHFLANVSEIVGIVDTIRVSLCCSDVFLGVLRCLSVVHGRVWTAAVVGARP